jgi:hypothetical protein
LDKTAFDTQGWAKLPYDAQLAKWAENTRPLAIQAATDPEHRANWLRCQGTWFVGVDVLTRAAPLAGPVLQAAQYAMGQKDFDWGLGQISTCYKGYPKQDTHETTPMFNYRRNRDFAHLDGLKAVGPDRARKMEEFHGFILGIPLNETPPKAAPFVIWQGSHLIFHDMLAKAYADNPPDNWHQIDITEIYQQTRAEIFKTCKRVEIHAKPREAYIVHRFALHGMAAWGENLEGPDKGRMVAYFRPYWKGEMQEWLTL